MILSLVLLVFQTTTFLIQASIILPLTRKIIPVLPYLGIWEFTCNSLSGFCLKSVRRVEDRVSAVEVLVTVFVYRLYELYWSLVFWPVLIRDAILGLPAFAADAVAAILGFLLGLASHRSTTRGVAMGSGSHKKSDRTLASESEVADTPIPSGRSPGTRTEPISSTAQPDLRKSSPSPSSSNDVHNFSSTNSTPSHKLSFTHPRRTTTTTSHLTPIRSKLAPYPSPSTTTNSPSLIFSTSNKRTVLVSLPTTGSTISSPLKFSTPPPPPRTKSKSKSKCAKRIQGRKKTGHYPATPTRIGNSSSVKNLGNLSTSSTATVGKSDRYRNLADALREFELVFDD